MALSFQPAGSNVQALVERVIDKSFPELKEAGVTINILFAYKTNKYDAPIVALRKDGHALAAKISITSQEDRARGQADCKLVIDDFGWGTMKDMHRAALIDHELRHLSLGAIKPTKKNDFATGLKRDDLGRPVIKICPHDWVLTGFARTAEIYGDYSIEARQFLHFKAEYGAQLELFGSTIASIVTGAPKQIDEKEAKRGRARRSAIVSETAAETPAE